jgi:hypothetical protein
MQRRRAHVRVAIANNRLEGIATSAATQEICDLYIRGEIEAGDLVTALKRRTETHQMQEPRATGTDRP